MIKYHRRNEGKRVEKDGKTEGKRMELASVMNYVYSMAPYRRKGPWKNCPLEEKLPWVNAASIQVLKMSLGQMLQCRLRRKVHGQRITSNLVSQRWEVTTSPPPVCLLYHTALHGNSSLKAWGALSNSTFLALFSYRTWWKVCRQPGYSGWIVLSLRIQGSECQ